MTLALNSSPKGNEPRTADNVRLWREGAKKRHGEIPPSARRAVQKRARKYKVRRTHRNAVTSVARLLSAHRATLPRCQRQGSRKMGVEREGCCRCNVVATAASAAACDRNHRRTGPRDTVTFLSLQQYTLAKQSHLHSPHYTRIYASTFDAGLRNLVAITHGQALGKERGRGKFFRARREPPNRCVMLHFSTVFFDSADVFATSAILRRSGVFDDIILGGIFEFKIAVGSDNSYKSTVLLLNILF